MRKSLRDLSPEALEEHRVLVRVDYNVPLDDDGRVRDATRVEATIPTIRHLLAAGGRPVLISHLGRPGGRVDPKYSLAPVAPVLEKRLGSPAAFIGSTDTEEAAQATRAMPHGSVLVLENTRFLAGETRNDPELARRLAALGDLFVNDAFGSTHRAHASVVGVTRYLRPAVAGLLVEAELYALGRLRAVPQRPFVVALGGAKIGDKIGLLEAFLESADQLIIGGAMANTFLAAEGCELGASLVEPAALEVARDLLTRSGGKLRLPRDLLVAEVDAPDAGDAVTVPADGIPGGMAALDIGPVTRREFSQVVREAGTVFWNGPMGLFERRGFEEGTFALASAAADATAAGAFTVVGGGDSASAIRQAGLAEAVSHVSTGGGAALEFLAEGTLPGVEALDEA